MLFETIVLSFWMTAGYQPTDNYAITEGDWNALTYQRESVWFVDVEPEINMCITDNLKLKLNGSILSQSTNDDMADGGESVWFRPYQMTYDFETSLNYKMITLGMSHICSHSVLTHNTENYSSPTLMDWSKTEFFVKIGTEIELFSK